MGFRTSIHALCQATLTSVEDRSTKAENPPVNKQGKQKATSRLFYNNIVEKCGIIDNKYANACGFCYRINEETG